MSISSLQKSSFHPVKLFQKIHTSKPINQEIQDAFENLNYHHICNLLEEGANPHQKIELSYKLQFQIQKENIKSIFDRTGFIMQFIGLSDEEIKQVPDQRVKELVTQMKQDLILDSRSVSDDQLVDLATTTFVGLPTSEEKTQEVPMMALAIFIGNIDIAKALVKAGFCFDEASIDALCGRRINICISESSHDEPQVLSLYLDCSFSLPEKLELKDLTMFDPKQVQQLIDLQDLGALVEVESQKAPIMGILSCEEAIALLDDFTIVDFLMENQVPTNQILSLNDDFAIEAELSEYHDQLIKAFSSRGFVLPEPNLEP